MLSHIDSASATRCNKLWDSFPHAVMFGRSIKKRNSSRSVSKAVRGVYFLKTCIFTHCYSTRISKTFKKGALCYWVIWTENEKAGFNKTCALLELLCDVWSYEQLTLSATSDRSEFLTGVCCCKTSHFIVRFAKEFFISAIIWQQLSRRVSVGIILNKHI